MAAYAPPPPQNVTWLSTSFVERDICHRLGGRFYGDYKMWYVPEGLDPEPFLRLWQRKDPPAWASSPAKEEPAHHEDSIRELRRRVAHLEIQHEAMRSTQEAFKAFANVWRQQGKRARESEPPAAPAPFKAPRSIALPPRHEPPGAQAPDAAPRSPDYDETEAEPATKPT